MVRDDADDESVPPELVGRLGARFREIAATSMADVPICNAALGVATLDFRVHRGRALGIVVTPWFMNLAAFDLLSFSGAFARPGEKIPLALPAGDVELIVGELLGFGRLDMCSLFSPMFAFADMDAAVATAREVSRTLFTPPRPEPAEPKPAFDRRAFLRGALAEARR